MAKKKKRKTLGQLAKLLRMVQKQTKMSQAEIGRKLGVNRGTISNLFRGRTMNPPRTVPSKIRYKEYMKVLKGMLPEGPSKEMRSAVLNGKQVLFIRGSFSDGTCLWSGAHLELGKVTAEIRADKKNPCQVEVCLTMED